MTSLSDVPLSVLSVIASHLVDAEDPIRSCLAPYATISRAWQSAIEYLTFRTIRIYSRERLQRFSDVVNCDRRKTLRSINLVIQLPDYNEDRYGEVEDHEDKHQNNRVFTNDIQHLYRTFEQWQQDDERSGNNHDRDARISLTVRAMSRSDELNMATEARLRRKRSGDLGKIEDIGGARYEASYLRLLAVLPQVSAIRELRLPQGTELLMGRTPEENRFCSPRRISGKTAIGMMSCCTSLSRADLELCDDYSKDLAFRQQERKALALALAELPPSLKHLRLYYPGVVPRNHEFSPPSIESADGRDLFSVKMGILSQQLISLDLTAVLSDDFFSLAESRSWPYLQRLEIGLNPCTPKGDWIIERDPLDSEDEELDIGSYEELSDWMRPEQMPSRMNYPENPFREAVKGDAMHDWYFAAADAASKMPRLELMKFRITPRIHFFEYHSDRISAGSVTWRSRSTTTYQPHDDVIAAWNRACDGLQGQLDVSVQGSTS